MKLIPLSQGQHAMVDDSDYDWLMQWKWYAKESRGHFYARRYLYSGGKQTNVWMHREILKPPQGMFSDHINRNPLDNQRINLRIATAQQNSLNVGKRRNNSSEFKGNYILYSLDTGKGVIYNCLHDEHQNNHQNI